MTDADALALYEIRQLSDEAQGLILHRLRNRHNLAPGLTVFKMQPIGSLRALYTRQNDTVTILEIMTHSQYDRMMKP